MNLREAIAFDFARIEEIASVVYATEGPLGHFNWPSELFHTELRQTKTLVIENSSHLISSFLSYRDAGDFFDISVLGTDPAWRRQGLQSELLQFLQGLAAKQQKTILLEVHPQNKSALRLYSKMKFRVINTRKGYYSDGSEALVMLWDDK